MRIKLIIEFVVVVVVARFFLPSFFSIKLRFVTHICFEFVEIRINWHYLLTNELAECTLAAKIHSCY